MPGSSPGVPTAMKVNENFRCTRQSAFGKPGAVHPDHKQVGARRRLRLSGGAPCPDAMDPILAAPPERKHIEGILVIDAGADPVNLEHLGPYLSGLMEIHRGRITGPARQCCNVLIVL